MAAAALEIAAVLARYVTRISVFEGPTPNLSVLIKIEGSMAASVTYDLECKSNTRSLVRASDAAESSASEP